MAENSLGSLVLSNQHSTNTQSVTATRRTADEDLGYSELQGTTSNILDLSNNQDKRSYHAAQKNNTPTAKIFPWMTESRNKLKSTGK